MLSSCSPIAKVVAAAVARPARRAVHHVVGVVRHARPRVAIAAPPRPSPAMQCLQKPGELPAGPGGATPDLRNAGASSGAVAAARLGAGAAGARLAGGISTASAGGAAGMLAALAVAAGLATGGVTIGGVTIASIMPDSPSPDTSSLSRIADDIQDPMGMLRLVEAIPGFAFPGLPTNLTLPSRLGPSTDTSTPGTRPSGPLAPALAAGVPAEAAPVAVPEPASIALLSLGGLGALLTRRWRRQAWTKLGDSVRHRLCKSPLNRR